MLHGRLDAPDLQKYAHHILVASRRASDLTKKLLAFARKGKYQSAPINLHMVIPEVTNMLGHSIDKKIEIKQVLSANPSVITGDPTQIQSALLNLAINAADAMPDGGELVFETSVVQLDDANCSGSPYAIEPGSYLRVSVTDSGCGIPEDILDRIFEPFFTTKEVGKGTGMGLAAVYGTVSQHGGAINISSEVGRGTTFNIDLPVNEQAAQHVKRTTNMIQAPRTASILVIDDEQLIRSMSGDMLASLGYSVMTGEDGDVGVACYKKHWREIDLVILDMVMPRMNGTDAFHEMKAINPDVKVLIASGYSINDKVERLLAEGALGFIQKPFEGSELSTKVAEAIQGADE
jgi:CheY-like chemotaxis protein